MLAAGMLQSLSGWSNTSQQQGGRGAEPTLLFLKSDFLLSKPTLQIMAREAAGFPATLVTLSYQQ